MAALWTLDPDLERLEPPEPPPAGLDAVVCSVVADRLEPLLSWLRARGCAEVKVLGRDLPVPMPSAYETPATLGMDRLAAALAAAHSCPEGALVVDAGSALTVDWVDGRGRFRGGAVAPGPRALEAGLQGAAPGLGARLGGTAQGFPGTSSAAACALGLAATLEGQVRVLIHRARAVAGGDLPVLLAGGAREAVRRCVPDVPFREAPHLVLQGAALAAAGRPPPAVAGAPPAT